MLGPATCHTPGLDFHLVPKHLSSGSCSVSPDPIDRSIVARGPCPHWVNGALKEESVSIVPSHLPSPLVLAGSCRRCQRNQGRRHLSCVGAQCGKNHWLLLNSEFEAYRVSYYVWLPWTSWSPGFVFTSGLPLLYSPYLLCFLLPTGHAIYPPQIPTLSLALVLLG